MRFSRLHVSWPLEEPFWCLKQIFLTVLIAGGVAARAHQQSAAALCVRERAGADELYQGVCGGWPMLREAMVGMTLHALNHGVPVHSWDACMHLFIGCLCAFMGCLRT